jgi:hypothetical protein
MRLKVLGMHACTPRCCQAQAGVCSHAVRSKHQTCVPAHHSITSAPHSIHRLAPCSPARALRGSAAAVVLLPGMPSSGAMTEVSCGWTWAPARLWDW